MLQNLVLRFIDNWEKNLVLINSWAIIGFFLNNNYIIWFFMNNCIFSKQVCTEF